MKGEVKKATLGSSLSGIIMTVVGIILDVIKKELEAKKGPQPVIVTIQDVVEVQSSLRPMCTMTTTRKGTIEQKEDGLYITLEQAEAGK